MNRSTLRRATSSSARARPHKTSDSFPTAGGATSRLPRPDDGRQRAAFGRSSPTPAGGAVREVSTDFLYKSLQTRSHERPSTTGWPFAGRGAGSRRQRRCICFMSVLRISHLATCARSQNV